MNEIKALRNLMKQLRQHHEYLLTLAEQKTTAIRNSHRKALKDVMLLEQEEVRTLRQMERERVRVVARVVEQYCPHLESTETMMDWLPYLPDGERTKVEGFREELQTVIQQLKAQNELNQQLLQDGLAVVRATLKAFYPSEDYIGYTSSATVRKPAVDERFSAFDSRA
ncbi:hypothetical protein HNR44_002356 [Geomicrobium halophilum]|uniref:FlgN protein n=1 Tax=Geomicrobium halophilum TaxID=549000 RepID=A0A841PZI3_9BACL|nr:hypothetical protein [Geomicrobium halophilum]